MRAFLLQSLTPYLQQDPATGTPSSSPSLFFGCFQVLEGTPRVPFKADRCQPSACDIPESSQARVLGERGGFVFLAPQIGSLEPGEISDCKHWK